jgi:hypothetical protein
MDFIERWLHTAPDGGNGILELALLTAGLAAIVAIAYRRAIRRAAGTAGSERA